VDPVVPSGNAPHYGKLLDLEMLVLTPRGTIARSTTPNQVMTRPRGGGWGR